MDKYQTLREAAEKATPGPWIAGDDEDSNRYLIGPEAFPGVVTIPVVSLHSEANADYIAAANPATIQALLAERDALRVALQDCVAVMENELNGLAIIRMELKQAKIALDQ